MPITLGAWFDETSFELDVLVASAMLEQSLGTPAEIRYLCNLWTEQGYQDHDECSLTACLSPLHPGPCKGWKHSLFQSAPEAYHALEAQRVEKANAKRLAKIQELKAQGKAIPKKLLAEIVAKPHPHAGQTAKNATGEAHAAGQAVTKAAEIKVSVAPSTNLPGKITLGQAVKAVPATPKELGPKGKKPTLASKGVAHVIAQDKVTPQYKLDKAASITPEQWSALSDADKVTIRGELEKIQNEGFGPQQTKAADLLAKLGAPKAPEPKPPALAKTGGPAAVAVPVPGKRVPLKRVGMAKTGGPAAKALPTPGHVEPKVLKPENVVGTPENVAKTGLPHPLIGQQVTAKSVLPGKKTMSGQLVQHEVVTDKTGPLAGKPYTLAMIKTAEGKQHLVVPESIQKAPEETPKLAVHKTPAHVSEAVLMSQGKAPGASWAKHQLTAYQKLSKEEYQGLSPDTKAKILADLQKGHGKFLDPKKKTATEELLAKFGHPMGGKAEPEPKVKNEDVQVGTHLYDHNITQAQADQAVAKLSPQTVASLAMATAGVTPGDVPDAHSHQNYAHAKADSIIQQVTAGQSAKVLAHPSVSHAMAEYRMALENQHFALSVGKAKNESYNKTATALAHKDAPGKELSPMQVAVLKRYQDHVLSYPVTTTAHEHSLLMGVSNQKAIALKSAIQQVDKTTSAGHEEPPIPAAWTNSHAATLLGPGALKPDLTLSPNEKVEVHGEAVATATEAIKGASDQLLTHPPVAAAYSDLLTKVKKLYLLRTQQEKLNQHFEAYHNKALSLGVSAAGHKLTSVDRAAIMEHRGLLKGEHGHLKDDEQKLMDQVGQAKAKLDQAVKDAKETPAGPSPLTSEDRSVIKEAYGKGWSKAAKAAVWYGTSSSWSKQQAIKNHGDFAAFNTMYLDLREKAGDLAVLHAEALAAKGTPGEKAAADAAKKAQDEFNALHKKAQLQLDGIRGDVGLQKRSLPKLDAVAVKTSAAETGYYKSPSGHYGTAAKQYILNKVGPKLGVAHKDYQDKYEEKAAKKQASTAKLQQQHQEFFENQAASKEANQGKYALPSHLASAGKHPNQEVANHFGFNYVGNADTNVQGFNPSNGQMYFTTPEEREKVHAFLHSADTKFGLDAQKQYPWSINNLQAKASEAGVADTTSAGWHSALYNYTGSGSASVNSTLNSNPPGAKVNSTTIKKIDAAMAAAPPLTGNVVLYRGFKDPKGVFAKSGKWNDTNVAGMEWSQRSYSSTSGSLSTAEAFGSGGVVMRIIIPQEMQIKGINAKGGSHEHENEIILQRGLRYRVVGDYGKSGHTRYIDVMVVPDPYAKSQ